MGLDMYLVRRSEEKSKGNSIEAYWRKANAIHNFFTRGKEYESCDDIEVNRLMLIDLKDRCTKVLLNRELADELLPTTNGFFFGSDEYDEYYYDSIAKTYEYITPLISNEDIKDGDLYYFGWY